MRRFETPYVADWLAVSLRWIVLVGLLISLALRSQINAVSLTVIFVMVFWNIVMSVLAGLNIRVRFHRYIVLAVDFLLAAAFFYLQGGLANASAWTALYPLLTGAVYFELLGSLVTGALFVLWQFIASPDAFAEGFTLSISSGLTLTILFTLLCGVGGRFAMRWLRVSRHNRLDAEDRRRNMESERLRAIYELTSTLTATLSYKRVLDSALDLGYTALNPNPDPDNPDNSDERLVSAVYLFRGNELRVGSARRFTNADMRVHLRGEEGILKKIFEDGEPFLSTDIGYDPELGRIIALRSCTSAYCFPLRSGFNVYGAMLFAHPDPNYFSLDRRGLLDIIGRQAVIAVQNARLYQDLVEEKERMIEVQEETRKKLARDLHDGPTQSVAAMAMRINLARRMMTKDVDEAGDELKKIEELALRTTKEIRHMLFTLRPLILESQGLTAALQAMAEKMRETFTQNVLINVDESMLENMEMGKQGVIFYIIEEAATNARKHASAVHIWVRLRSFETGIALLEIEDDGLGFNVEAMNKSYDKRGSLGMVNLRERTELVNGLLNIDSAPGKGTRIQVYIPLTEEAADRLHHAKR